MEIKLEKKKVLCVYHKGDNDGRFSAAVVKSVYKENVHTVGWNFKEPISIKRLESELGHLFDLVIIVDLPLLAPIAEWANIDVTNLGLLKNTTGVVSIGGADVLWFDHHIGNEVAAKKVGCWPVNGKHDIKFSAAKIVYDYYVEKKMIRNDVQVINYVDTYDCWKKKAGPVLWENALDFNFGLPLRKNYNKIETIVKLFFDDHGYEEKLIDDIIRDGSAIRGYLDEQGKWLKKEGIEHGKLLGYDAIFVNSTFAKSYLSDIFKDGKSIIVMYSRSDGEWNYSLRTNNPDIDLSKIAAKYGGGGHRKSAGFTSDHLFWEE